MGRARKYQLSIGLSSDLIDMIEKAVEDGGYSSRSQFVEDIIRENIHERCITCEIHRLLSKNGIDIRYIEMPKTLDQANDYVKEYKRTIGKARHAERTILDIIVRFQQNGGGIAQLLDVINEAERENISRSKAEEIIEKFNQSGRLMRPNGYDTLQIV
jgi:metal-responsive CopG/Arc/MetJ family transcriptional regulator